jgi:hypothetical protein
MSGRSVKVTPIIKPEKAQKKSTTAAVQRQLKFPDSNDKQATPDSEIKIYVRQTYYATFLCLAGR